MGKQRGGDPAKPPAEGRHTDEDSVFPINFSPSDTGQGAECYTTIFSCIYSLAPPSLGWALSWSREERQSSECWCNLCGPWRAEAARGDQTRHQGRWEPKQYCIGFSRQGRKVFSSAEIRSLLTVSGDERKIKTLRGQPKGRDLWVSF